MFKGLMLFVNNLQFLIGELKLHRRKAKKMRK